MHGAVKSRALSLTHPRAEGLLVQIRSLIGVSGRVTSIIQARNTVVFVTGARFEEMCAGQTLATI